MLWICVKFVKMLNLNVSGWIIYGYEHHSIPWLRKHGKFGRRVKKSTTATAFQNIATWIYHACDKYYFLQSVSISTSFSSVKCDLNYCQTKGKVTNNRSDKTIITSRTFYQTLYDYITIQNRTFDREMFNTFEGMSSIEDRTVELIHI